ncbi:hypothetical protein JI739_18095 [Ramlibacter sp. AW1]|uniref:Uncharacterized protein n=1 Tax=Ramlibacter aurantiacus TaxID=2801330 RepID=A0A936ZW80_9BURK|nr:hypothetical protein [Ramlibacter aurantiacus]MBL0422265.1 hypothetical protein [Ramlibacter aurantiacus]
MNSSLELDSLAGNRGRNGVSTKRSSTRLVGIGIALALVWAAINLPAVFLSGWFPLDLPELFFMGENLEERLAWIISPYNGSGRYFPVYWLYHCLQYPLFGSRTGAYLLTQSLLFLAGTLIASRLTTSLSRSTMAGAVVFGAIYLGTSIGENLTTVGKAEPLSFVLVVCVLMLARIQMLQEALSIRRGLAIAVLFAIAMLTKETSMVLLGFAGVGAALSWMANRIEPTGRKIESETRQYLWFFGWLAAGLALAKLPYLLFPRTDVRKSYTSYEVSWGLIEENLRFYLWQHPDILFFGVLSVGTLLILWQRQLRVAATEAQAQKDLIFVSSLCALGWGYWLALLIWRWPMTYYLLLPSVAFKVCAIYALVQIRRTYGSGLAYRTAVLFTVAMLVYSAAQIYYVTASQIAYSRIYTAALHKVATLPGIDRSRLILDTYPFFAEQIGGTSRLLKTQLGVPLEVRGIGELTDPAVLNKDVMDILGIDPAAVDSNTRSLPNSGDYVLSFTGRLMGLWFLRGVAPFYNDSSLLQAQGWYDMDVVAESEIRFPAWFPHVWHHRPAVEHSSVGYKLYKVKDDKPRFFWKGRFPDGWIGPAASLVVSDRFAAPLSVKFSVPAHTLPVTLAISRNDEPFKTIEVGTPDELVINLAAADSVGDTEWKFNVSRSFVPKEMNINRDKRRLAARIALSPDPARQTTP